MNRWIEVLQNRPGSMRHVVDDGAGRFECHPARSWNLRILSALEDFSRNLQDVQGAGPNALESANGPKSHDFGHKMHQGLTTSATWYDLGILGNQTGNTYFLDRAPMGSDDRPRVQIFGE